MIRARASFPHAVAHSRNNFVSPSPHRGSLVSNVALSSSLIHKFPLKKQNIFIVSRFSPKDTQPFEIRCAQVEKKSLIFSAKVLLRWLNDNSFPEQPVAIESVPPKGLGCVAKRDIQKGEAVVRIPENFCVTRVDVSQNPKLASAILGRDDLVSLTLWLMHENSLQENSVWYRYLRVFPATVHLSPLNWSPQQLQEWLKGSPVLLEIQDRIRVIKEEFLDLKSKVLDARPQDFPSEIYNLESFKKAFSVLLSRVIFLPSANSFALIPVADFINHSADADTSFDYSPQEQAVLLYAHKEYKKGEQVYASYIFGSDRSYSDLLLNYGIVEESSKNNFMNFQVSLVSSDRLYSLKSQLLAETGLLPQQNFPIFEDRFPTQLLTYVRLSRLSDPALFAKIAFERDSKIDDANEYEVLMLLIAECRDRLSGYASGLEEDLRLLNREGLDEKERVGAKVRILEKTIFTNTMNALRKRLAPIRGIPAKGGGLQDPNSDIKEMFEIMEEGLSAPRKFLSALFKK